MKFDFVLYDIEIWHLIWVFISFSFFIVRIGLRKERNESTIKAIQLGLMDGIVFGMSIPCIDYAIRFSETAIDKNNPLFCIPALLFILLGVLIGSVGTCDMKDTIKEIFRFFGKKHIDI